MNHNFLPFDICEMLPKENPNRLANYYNGYHKKGYYEKYEVLPYKENTFSAFLIDRKYETVDRPDSLTKMIWVRDAWTINDAVEWLITQGYAVSVEFDNPYRSYWSLKIRDNNNWLDCWFDGEKRISCKSRIEAYTKGIRHCLNLIKDGKRN